MARPPPPLTAHTAALPSQPLHFFSNNTHNKPKKQVTSAEADKAALVSQIDSLQAVQDRAQQEADELTRQATQIEKMRDAEASGDFVKLKQKESDLSKDVVKVS